MRSVPPPSLPASSTRAVTRRSFLRYSATAVGGVAFGGVLGSVAETAAAAGAAGAPTLAPERRQTFIAMIEALDGPVTGVDSAHAEQAANELASRYRDETPELRRNIDLVLDAVDPEARPGGFAKMDVRARRQLLHDAWVGYGALRPEADDARTLYRPALVQNAMSLATRPFAVDLGGYA